MVLHSFKILRRIPRKLTLRINPKTISPLWMFVPIKRSLRLSSKNGKIRNIFPWPLRAPKDWIKTTEKIKEAGTDRTFVHRKCSSIDSGRFFLGIGARITRKTRPTNKPNSKQEDDEINQMTIDDYGVTVVGLAVTWQDLTVFYIPLVTGSKVQGK